MPKTSTKTSKQTKVKTTKKEVKKSTKEIKKASSTKVKKTDQKKPATEKTIKKEVVKKAVKKVNSKKETKGTPNKPKENKPEIKELKTVKTETSEVDFINDDSLLKENDVNDKNNRIQSIRENKFSIEAKKLEDIIDVGMASYDDEEYKEKLLKAFRKSYKNLELDVGKDTAKELLNGLKTGALLDNYNGDNDDKINEALVMIIQDEKVSEDVKEKTTMKLIRRNVGMIHRCINIFQSGVNGRDDGKISNEDLQQEAQIAFIRAIKTYDLNREDRTKFSSYCYRVIYNAFSSLFTDKINKRRRNETSLDATLTKDSDEKDASLEDFVPDNKQKNPEQLAMEDNRSVILREAIRKLSPTQRFLAYTRFGLNDSDKITQVDIAEFLDVSQANISKAETGMLQQLKVILLDMGLTGADLFKEYD